MRDRKPDRVGRGAFFLFVGIVVLAVLQLAWWTIFLLRISADRRHVVMFASEGAFFLLALLAGVLLIYRTLLEQVRLKNLRATFLSAVTHELKSPLASLRLFLETIEAGRVDEAKRRDLVRKMLLDVDRLERLVGDLLRAGQLETHSLRLERARVDLAPVLADARRAVEPRLGAEDSLLVDAPEGIVVEGDRDLLRSVVENLLDNAVKYSKPPRRIEARLAREGRAAVLEVRDNGIGIDRSSLAALFEPFHRAGDEETRAVKGTGLGLFLVRGILRAHGGDCEAASDGPGRGATLRCRLPLAEAGA